jgi:hypothetical protein
LTFLAIFGTPLFIPPGFRHTVFGWSVSPAAPITTITTPVPAAIAILVAAVMEIDSTSAVVMTARSAMTGIPTEYSRKESCTNESDDENKQNFINHVHCPSRRTGIFGPIMVLN